MPNQSISPYKEPVFLFTSSSLRKAAWAGWHSAFGDREETEKMIHEAYAEWSKEIGIGRRYSFFDRHNLDIWKYIPPPKLAQMISGFFKEIKKEITNGKKLKK